MKINKWQTNEMLINKTRDRIVAGVFIFLGLFFAFSLLRTINITRNFEMDVVAVLTSLDYDDEYEFRRVQFSGRLRQPLLPLALARHNPVFNGTLLIEGFDELPSPLSAGGFGFSGIAHWYIGRDGRTNFGNLGFIHSTRNFETFTLWLSPPHARYIISFPAENGEEARQLFNDFFRWP